MKIQSLPFNSTKQLTKHINAQELRCKCGGTHAIFYDIDLLNKVEMIMEMLDIDKVIIPSGYRCPKHDRAVGGNGRGQHTVGCAIDAKFIKDEKFVSTKIISCVAQELGFRGIANINKDYSSIHLDNRASGTYYGNELKGLHTVTNDFFSYYKLTHKEVDAYKPATFKAIWNYKANSYVKELQTLLNLKGNKLVADGKAGDKTFEAVKKYTISMNDKGTLTAWTKKRLRQLRCPSGDDTNVADIVTVAGIKLFEKLNNLKVDGVISGNDWYYLIK